MTDSAQAGIQAANRTPSDGPSRPEFTAVVTGVREMTRLHGKQIWQIALSQTRFTPDRCRGTLTATARSGRTLCIEVTHAEADASGTVWHTTDKPLQEGTPVKGDVHVAAET